MQSDISQRPNMLRPIQLIVLIWCIVSIWGYKFDKSGCDNMLPTFDSVKGTSPGDESNKTKSDHNDKDGISNSEDLSPAFDKSPYKIVVSASKYRRNRPMTVRIEGGEFHGFLLQARRFQDGVGLGPSIIGSFFDLPSGVGTLDCTIGNTYSVANSAFSKNATAKKDLQLKWKAPSDDAGSIEFVATMITGQRYWTSVKSQSLLFNEFPPSLEKCGKDRSCYRYSDVRQGCGEDGFCDYVVVSQVVQQDVIFTIGGKIKSATGYVGIGFSDQHDVMSYIDMSICIKTSSQKAEAANYMVHKRGQAPEKQNVQMEDAEADIDGSNIWCRFRRQLQIPNSKGADLTKSLHLLFLWGELDANTQNPVLPKEDKITNAVQEWNYTQTLDSIHYVGGANVLTISWTIFFALMLATFIELCSM